MHIPDALKLSSSGSKEFRWLLKVCWTFVEVTPEVVPGKCPVLDRLYSKQLVLLCIVREEQSQSTDFWLCFLSISSPNLV